MAKFIKTMRLKSTIIKHCSLLRFLCYHKLILPIIVWHKRRKDKIRILFVLQNLSEWKTETLYLEMKDHPRIEPLLGITLCLETPGEENNIIKYCEEKGYEYTTLNPKKNLVSQVHPDFIIHQKPYIDQIDKKYRVSKNLSAPCVLIHYATHTTMESFGINSYLSLRSWKNFFENQSTLDAHKKKHRLGGINFLATGLPFMDKLTLSADQFSDPWPAKDGMKRIIYAPHHSVPPHFKKGYNYSTFMENGEFMLEMRKKFEDKVYFVFKPHPLLYK